MPRLLFEKTGNAVWISHLDLMRLFQRAFKRAGLHLTHTQGFNPRPAVSIALPLSVGMESGCELLDFDLDGKCFDNEQIRDRLNSALVEGVRVLSVYNSGSKIKDIALLSCEVTLEYDHGAPEGAETEIKALFSRKSLMMEKKSKNGITEQDIIPMVRKVDLLRQNENCLILTALICCQNPSLNPAMLSSAVIRYLPKYGPDFSKCRRVELYDSNVNIFR